MGNSSVTSRGKSIQCKTSIVFNNKLFKSQEFYLTSTVFGEGSGTPLQSLAWKIPWTEEPGGLQSMGSLRVGHD